MDSSPADEVPSAQAHAGEVVRAGDAAGRSDDRPLTLSETLEGIRTWYARRRGGWVARLLTAAVLMLGGALIWVVLARLIPWPGGIVESTQRVLALNVPWPPLPAPDDALVAADAGLVTAAWVGAPLVIAVFWFAAAYHLDRASRRTYRVSEIPGVRHSRGYTIMAILAVFPLIILGLIAGAWGAFAVITWAIAREAWGSTLTLAAVLLALVALVRLANAILDRRAVGR